VKTTSPFHTLIKPIGAKCNLDCSYCFYLEKENLYSKKSDFKLTQEILEKFIPEYIEANYQLSNEVNFGWQGGEPTLRGLDFFEEAILIQTKYQRPGLTITNSIQTNGVLIDDKWAKFLKENQFLVGISIDGPEDLHDLYRVDKAGKGSFKAVESAIKLLTQFGVEFNTLTVVNSVNAEHPQRVYDHLKSTGSKFIQFIPIVDMAEYQNPCEMISGQSKRVLPHSVSPKKWGEFLMGVFSSWIKSRDVGEIFIQQFDMRLATMMDYPATICVHAKYCGRSVAMEHNGDIYSCDHYVSEDYLLGNIEKDQLADMVNSEFQNKFGFDKFDTLPTQCLKCEFLKSCYGTCPKDRILTTKDGDENLAYLCRGYIDFFTQTKPTFMKMKKAIESGGLASDILEEGKKSTQKISKNDPCPCGSKKQFKRCCGK
jgi:uncharacterized protein